MDLSTIIYTTTTRLFIIRVYLGTICVISAFHSVPLPIYSPFAYLNGGTLVLIYNSIYLLSTSNQRRAFIRHPYRPKPAGHLKLIINDFDCFVFSMRPRTQLHVFFIRPQKNMDVKQGEQPEAYNNFRIAENNFI
jgi:hypothetical protein